MVGLGRRPGPWQPTTMKSRTPITVRRPDDAAPISIMSNGCAEDVTPIIVVGPRPASTALDGEPGFGRLEGLGKARHDPDEICKAVEVRGQPGTRHEPLSL